MFSWQAYVVGSRGIGFQGIPPNTARLT